MNKKVLELEQQLYTIYLLENTVIGGNSYVNKNFYNAVYFGIPAKR